MERSTLIICIISILIVFSIVFVGKKMSRSYEISLMNYKEWCQDGHVYYYRSHEDGILAIKLDDDGKPVKCEGTGYLPNEEMGVSLNSFLKFKEKHPEEHIFYYNNGKYDVKF